MLRKNTFLLAIVASLMMLIVNTANADLITWGKSDVPDPLTTYTASVTAVPATSNAIAVPSGTDGFKIISGAEGRYQVELDFSQFLVSGTRGPDFLEFSFSPGLVGDYIAGLENIVLFGGNAQEIDLSTDGGNQFYSFYTGDLYGKNGNTSILFDIVTKGASNELNSINWSVAVKSGNRPNESEGGTPEPATMLIFGLGIAGLGLARRRMVK